MPYVDFWFLLEHSTAFKWLLLFLISAVAGILIKRICKALRPGGKRSGTEQLIIVAAAKRTHKRAGEGLNSRVPFGTGKPQTGRNAIAAGRAFHDPSPVSPPRAKPDRNYAEELMDLGDAYVSETHLMSSSERDIYKVLERRYGDRYYIFSQVRVVDLIQPNTQKYPRRSKEYTSLFRQLSQWHFDYVLCEKDDFRVFCALELDDSSHEQADRVKRDRILDQACEVAGVHLKRMKINHADRRVEMLC
ncbi:hypothetical protein GCM10027040_20190 [Halomonas shantousis]